jgi:tRNA threonylcarbamoyladenosine modification (KEOPS) complex  Pcc1 subunit
MFEAKINIECKNPDLIKKSLEQDIKNDEQSETVVKAEKNEIEIKIKSKKLSYLKAIINSYISLVSMLIEVDKDA